MFNKFNAFCAGLSSMSHLRYMALMGAYGGISKAVKLHDASVVKDKSYDAASSKWIIERQPMLYVDKAMIVGISGMMSPWIWPYFLYNDLAELERYAKGYPSESKKDHVIYYIF